MFELIVESEKVEATKDGCIQFYLANYFLKIGDIEFNITDKIVSTAEFNFSCDKQPTANIIFKTDEVLNNIPVIFR